MHHFDGEKNFFNYNSDLSGDVEVGTNGLRMTFKINARDLLDFLADVVRNRRIAALEDAAPDEILFDTKGPADDR